MNKGKQTSGFLAVFIFVVLVSPFVWVFIRNSHYVISGDREPRLLRPSGDVFLTEVNTLQSQTRISGLGVPGRIFVNKYSLYAKEVVNRYLESFDLGYLFFTGDLNFLKSTRENGPLLASFLPLIIVGLGWHINDKRFRLLWILAIVTIPGAFVEQHFESVSRTPLFLTLMFLAAEGWLWIFAHNRKYAFLVLALVLFDFARFLDFFLHHYKPLI